MITCLLCGSAVKLVPAGTSKKTGKPYDAFYSCQNRDCGKTYKCEATGTPAMAMNNVAKKTEDDKWEKISEGKVRHGVSIAYIEKGEKLNMTTINEINAWVDYIMTGKPFTKNVEQSMKEDGLIVDEIPF